MLMSQTTWSTFPPPTAKPLTAAMIGLGIASISSYTSMIGSTWE
jgi:hypothetical protein